jgi:hypothetical protein
VKEIGQKIRLGLLSINCFMIRGYNAALLKTNGDMIDIEYRNYKLIVFCFCVNCCIYILRMCLK